MESLGISRNSFYTQPWSSVNLDKQASENGPDREEWKGKYFVETTPEKIPSRTSRRPLIYKTSADGVNVGIIQELFQSLIEMKNGQATTKETQK